MKNVLIIHQSAELYGSDKTLLTFLKRVDRKLINPVVILPNSGPLKEVLEDLKIIVFVLPVLKLYRGIFTPFGIIKFIKEYKIVATKLKELHKHYQFQTVYSNTLAVLAGAFFSKKNKIKHVWHVHEIIQHPKLIAAIFPKLLKKYATVIICNSQATQANILSRIPALKNRTKVIYNGVNDIWDSPQTEKAPLKPFVVTLVGRISRLKGHQWAINALEPLLKTNQIKLLFVGSPVPNQENYLEQVKALIQSKNLAKQVEIIPFTKGLTAIWHQTDLALMPSTEAESFGLVAAEAMLACKPVIATNLGGLKEVIKNNETGFLIPVNDNEAFLKSVTVFLENPSLIQQMGTKGRVHVLTQFSVQKFVKEVQDTL